ncbi:renal dipeptidase family [Microdochium bolleyi]|uniref:Dipeptidase n=1 Tax=Microdochium bolleyi TaxID=196109 RepID=A0A136IJK5_9PEZI|nr:renal dipeptidase family [Microdochium bolleyi]
MTDTTEKYMQEALQLMREVPLIDGHNDWIHMIRAYYDFQFDDRFGSEKDLAGHVDVKRLIAGRAGAVFWSVYVDCPDEDGFSDEVHFERVRDTLQQIDLLYRVVDRYSDKLEIVRKSADIMSVFQSGKCASLIGVEGLHQIANSSSILRIYHRLGVRYVTLAHDKNNAFVDSATSAGPVHNGISEKGVEMIREMNRIGMMIDLSHTSEAVMHAALERSLAPVIFSHSSAYGLVPHPRNVPDAVLDKLKEKRGLIMISFIPWITNVDPKQASVDDVVDHIVYVAERIGFDHVGLGSDYDGMPSAPRGLEDVSKYPAVVATMLQRKIARSDVAKVMGLNLIRVMGEVETVANAQSAVLPVLEDGVKQLWNDDIRAFVKREYPDAEHCRPRV